MLLPQCGWSWAQKQLLSARQRGVPLFSRHPQQNRVTRPFNRAVSVLAAPAVPSGDAQQQQQQQQQPRQHRGRSSRPPHGTPPKAGAGNSDSSSGRARRSRTAEPAERGPRQVEQPAAGRPRRRSSSASASSSTAAEQPGAISSSSSSSGGGGSSKRRNRVRAIPAPQAQAQADAAGSASAGDASATQPLHPSCSSRDASSTASSSTRGSSRSHERQRNPESGSPAGSEAVRRRARSRDEAAAAATAAVPSGSRPRIDNANSGSSSSGSSGGSSSNSSSQSRNPARARQPQQQHQHQHQQQHQQRQGGSNYWRVGPLQRSKPDFNNIKDKPFGELQQLLDRHGNTTSVGNLVAIASRLKSVPAEPPAKAELLEQLWRCLQPRLQDCNPRQCAEVMLTASKIQHGNSSIYQQCLQQVLPGLQDANARILCNVIYAIGTAAPGTASSEQLLQQVHQHVVPAFVARAGEISVLQTVSNAIYAAALSGISLPLEELLRGKPTRFYAAAKPQELSNTMYAAALMVDQQGAPPRHEMTQLLNGLLQCLHDARPQHISNALWAATITGFQLQRWQLQQLVEALLGMPPEPQPLGLAVWSAAKLDLKLPQPVVDRLLQQLLPVLDCCQPQTISNTVWGLATMGCRILPQQAEQLLEALVQPGRAANDQAVANTMWGFATMGAELPEPLLARVFALFAELLPRAGQQATANALWAAATLPEPYRPQQLLTPAAVQHIAAKIPAMKAQELSNIAMACGVLGVRDLSLVLPVFDTAIKRLRAGGLSLQQGPDSAGLQLQACCNLCWCGSVLDLPEVAGHCCELAAAAAAASWPALVTEDKVQLYQLHIWLADTGHAGGGLQGRLSRQQLAECKAAWQKLMRSSSRSSGSGSTSQLQRNVFAVAKKVPGLLTPTLETCTHDELFSVDIMAATAAAPDGSQSLLAIEVDGPWHFTRPDQGLTGSTLYRNRALAARGYCVVSVPYWEWRPLADRGEEAQRRYLEDKVTHALAQQQQQRAEAEAEAEAEAAQQAALRP